MRLILYFPFKRRQRPRTRRYMLVNVSCIECPMRVVIRAYLAPKVSILAVSMENINQRVKSSLSGIPSPTSSGPFMTFLRLHHSSVDLGIHM